MSGSTPVGPPFWMKLLGGPLGGGLDLGLLTLRLGFGLMMLVGHGIPKFQGYSTILEKGFLDPFGMGAANSLTAAVVSETVLAAMVAAGLLTRLACIPLVVTMAVAAFVAHANDPVFLGGGAAKEPALVYLIAFLTLLFTGPGRFSVDGLMMQPRKEG
ncbi:MAG: DoxX family protein [Gemmataceae bacterium]